MGLTMRAPIVAAEDVLLDSAWVLEPFQAGEPPLLVEHIFAAVKILAEDPDAVLVISGGQTRKAAGPLSEAAS